MSASPLRQAKTTLPGEWPGQCSTSKVRFPDRHARHRRASGRSHRVGLRTAIAGGDLRQVLEQVEIALVRSSTFTPVLAASSATPPMWSMMPVRDQYLFERGAGPGQRRLDLRDIAARSTIAALLVAEQTMIEQFCWKGVTGTTAILKGCMFPRDLAPA